MPTLRPRPDELAPHAAAQIRQLRGELAEARAELAELRLLAELADPDGQLSYRLANCLRTDRRGVYYGDLSATLRSAR